MTTKKKTLIELMLDAGVKPNNIDERIEFFVSDEPNKSGESCISGYSTMPKFMEKTNEFHHSGYIDLLCKTPYHPEDQGNQIVTKQQFIDAYESHERFKNLAPIPVQNCKCTVTPVLSTEYKQEVMQCNSLEESEKLSADYVSLSKVLRRAYDQAAVGKGAERHAKDLPFTEQPMQRLQELYGVGFALGQAGKKMQESMRLPHYAAIRELLGAINYIAGAVIYMEKENNK